MSDPERVVLDSEVSFVCVGTPRSDDGGGYDLGQLRLACEQIGAALAQKTAAPWEWEPVLTAYVEHGAANAVGSLIFPYQPRSAYKIKLVYVAPHGFIQADTDKVNDYISADWLAVEAAIKCVRFRVQSPGGEDKRLTPLLNDLMNRAAQLRKRHRPVMPMPFPQLGAQAIGENTPLGLARTTTQ